MPKLTGFPRVPLPGPAPAPLLGHLPATLRFFQDPIAEISKLRAHGDVVGIVRDNPALVFVFGRARNREVLSRPADFQHAEDFIRGREGTPMGRMSSVVININGEAHRRHRRLMMPAFGKSALAGYADDIVAVTEASIERWPTGQVADLDRLLHDLALSVAIRTLFGLDSVEDGGELGELATDFVLAMAQPLSLLLPYDLPGLPFRRTQRLAGRVLARLEQLIADKRRRGAHDKDALARLIHAVDDEETRFSDDELVSEALTLFIAGHETLAKTMTWTMLLLERHPAVLADVLDEIDGVLGGRSVTRADIPRMPLLDWVIKESMRVLSPVPLLFLRVCQQDMALGSFRVPKGANVVVSPFATHHDPELYSDPRRFSPERWQAIKPTLYGYLPFGAGARVCSGATFASQALRLMLPTVLQRARVAIVPDANIDPIARANILRPRYGMPVELQAPHRRRLTPARIRGHIHELVELDG